MRKKITLRNFSSLIYIHYELTKLAGEPVTFVTSASDSLQVIRYHTSSIFC